MGNSSGKIDPVESVKNCAPSIFSNDIHHDDPSCAFFNLFVCNTYLIPTLGINVKNTIACRQQSERAEALGKLIMNHKPDIVCLQEIWGAGLGPLEQELVPPNNNSNINPEKKSPSSIFHFYDIDECCKSWGGWTIADVVAQKMNKRGGLYLARLSSSSTSQPITQNSFDSTEEKSKWYLFQNSLTKSNKGCVVAKYQKLSETSNTPSNLFVFNTHLDPTNKDDVQIRQLSELATFMNMILSSQASNQNNVSSKYNKNEADDLDKKSMQKPKLDFTAVIVGDFNFNKSSEQYKKMFEIFQQVGGIELDADFSNSLDHDSSTYSGVKNPFVYWGAGKKDLGRIDLIFAVKTISGIPLSKKVEIVQQNVLDDVYVSDHFPFEIRLKC